MSERLSSAQWTEFWHGGAATTFLGRFEHNYEGEVAAFWEQQFATCPQHAAIVDLAAGNGALAALAVAYAETHGCDFDVAAVDFADVQPSVYAGSNSELVKRLQHVDFRSKTGIEATGLPDARFDLGVSQFGFEYGNMQAAAAELDRILKPSGATFAAIMHDHESEIVVQAKEGLRQARLCVKSGIAETARELLTALEQLRRKGQRPEGNPLTEPMREALNKKTGQLSSQASRFKESGQIEFFLGNVLMPFRANGSHLPYVERLQMVDSAKLQTEAYMQRMRDLIDVAAAIRADQLAVELKRYGFDVADKGPFYFEGVLFGQQFVAKR